MLDLNKKRAEKILIDAAYEPLTAEKIVQINAIIARYPDLAKIYKTHLELKNCLKQVEPPAHQLSSERLRNAILNSQSAHKSCSQLDWWLVSIFGVVACAGLLMVIKGLGHHDFEVDNPINKNYAYLGKASSAPVGTDSLTGLLNEGNQFIPTISPTDQANLPLWDKTPFQELSSILPGLAPFKIVVLNTGSASKHVVQRSGKNNARVSGTTMNSYLASDMSISSRSGFKQHQISSQAQYASELHEVPSNTVKSSPEVARSASGNKVRPGDKRSQSTIVDIIANSSSSTGLPPAKEVVNSQDIPLGS